MSKNDELMVEQHDLKENVDPTLTIYTRTRKHTILMIIMCIYKNLITILTLKMILLQLA
jgi:hypothetical protein